jgi:hypothetical protein
MKEAIQMPRTFFTRPIVLLRIEGAAVLASTLALYQWHGGNWLLFALLLLAPDLAALGYFAGPRVGAAIYNAAHLYALPIALGVYGVLGGNALAFSLALIWAAHIGMDRMLGYGLKYPSAFQDTHLGRIGRKPAVTKDADSLH